MLVIVAAKWEQFNNNMCDSYVCFIYLYYLKDAFPYVCLLLEL